MERLRSDTSAVMILDGGTGEELFLRGVPDDRKIWSAKAVVDATYHQALRDVHRSFIEAGSDAVTTNSYGIVSCSFRSALRVLMKTAYIFG